jgi:ParB-like chromosome segregation protein Spo0J
MSDILPDLSSEDYETLKSSIEDDGVEMPIVVDQDKKIIDGKHRRRACDELGIECPTIVRHVKSERERLQLRLQLNCSRRQ